MARERLLAVKLISSTPEKEAALEKLKPKNKKTTRSKKKKAAVKKIVPPIVYASSDDNDDDVEDQIPYHGESSDYDEDFSEMDCFSELAELAVKDPEIGDLILVKLIPINSTKGSPICWSNYRGINR